MTQEYLNKIERLDFLIRLKATGTPDQLASRLGMSKRSVINYLKLMRDNGAPIKFCHIRQSYYYIEEGFFKISFSFKKKEASKLQNI
jgi:predicted DNA-binding transcriptional regulator YafY